MLKSEGCCPISVRDHAARPYEISLPDRHLLNKPLNRGDLTGSVGQEVLTNVTSDETKGLAAA